MIEVFTDDTSLLLHCNDRWSEISPLPGWNQETIASCLDALFSENFDRYPSVAFAIDSLFIDCQVPIAPFAALLTGSPADILTQADQAKTRIAKVKVGSLSLKETLDIVVQLLNLGFHLRLDFNRQWSLDDALAISHAFPENTFDYFEEPTADLDTFAKKTIQPIALDESLLVNIPWDLPRLKALVLKPSAWGSIGDCLELAQKAYQHKLQIVLSNAFRTKVGLSNILTFSGLLKRPLAPLGLGTLAFPDYHLDIDLNTWERIGAVSLEPTLG